LRGHHWRVYIAVVASNGSFGSYQEVTDDCDIEGLGTIDQQLDNTDYNIGIYRNSNLSITFRNDTGKYSDTGQPNSMFTWTRGGSLVKLTWQGSVDPPKCGFTIADGTSCLAVETTLFIGILDDSSVTMNFSDQKVTFSLMGRETVFNNVNVPFTSPTIVAGSLISDIIKVCLNQTVITNVLTYSASLISVGLDSTVDSVADLQNKTVWEALQDLLLITNSILYILSDSIYVQPRTVGSTLQFTFYGESSIVGAENIIDITNLKSGLSRTFNYLFWTPSNQASSDSISISKYGVQSKEFNFSYITNTTNQSALLASILAEFSNPKREMDIVTPLTYTTIALFLLNKVAIDFPPVYLPGNNAYPICGTAVCGTAVLPNAIFSFTENPANFYKIIGSSIDPSSDLITFSLRAV
jgi:hypothetical protein